MATHHRTGRPARTDQSRRTYLAIRLLLAARRRNRFHTLAGPNQHSAFNGGSADLQHCRLTAARALQGLAFTRRERVFQRCTALDVAQRVLAEHGMYPIEVRECPELARWRHLSQHRDPESPQSPEQFETDLHFVLRVLAAEGLSLWFEPDEAGERIVIGRAGTSARPAKPGPLGVATPAGLSAPMAEAEHLLDFDLPQRSAPNVARVWAYNYRDAGRALSAEYEADPRAPLGLGDSPTVQEEPRHGADALIFEGNHTSGVQAWLQAQARLLGQRHNQTRQRLKASSNAAGLWRCGQTLQLASPGFGPGLGAGFDALWLLTRVEAGSHVGPWLQALPDDPPTEPGAAQAYVHFEASPLARWVTHGWVPEPLPSATLDLEHARVGATPGSPYAYLDQHGRYQLEINADQNRSSAPPGGTSRPARHIRGHAGPDYGWHLPLHASTEVLVAYHAGHPDTPLIAGALHHSSHPDPVTAINASRNVLRTWANNKFRLEDWQGEEHIKLSTEYGLGQLNLGHHVDAQRLPRGEGVELRTDQWGALRAGRGLLVTTFAGQPRGGLGGAGEFQGQAQGFAPAHQLYNPGAQDVQGAQAMAEQRSAANAQVGLGELDALTASRQLADQTLAFSAPILHYASAEHLMHLTPASQLVSASTVSLSAQGSVELASADQIRLYARQGITWHTEGADPTGAGQGGARADIISQGSDETQVFDGNASILAEHDVVLEFRGDKALCSAAGATLELSQAGQLTITANQAFVSEAGSHKLGGALDWGSGTGSAATGPLNWWGKMGVEEPPPGPPLKFDLRLSDTPGGSGHALAHAAWKIATGDAPLGMDLVPEGALVLQGRSDAVGAIKLSSAEEKVLADALRQFPVGTWLVYPGQTVLLHSMREEAEKTDEQKLLAALHAGDFTRERHFERQDDALDALIRYAQGTLDVTAEQSIPDAIKKT